MGLRSRTIARALRPVNANAPPPLRFDASDATLREWPIVIVGGLDADVKHFLPNTRVIYESFANEWGQQ